MLQCLLLDFQAGLCYTIFEVICMQELVHVFNREELICIVHVDYSEQSIYIENLIPLDSPEWFCLPFGRNTQPTWQDYNYYLSTRCFPSDRTNKKELLKSWGLDEYDPDKIVRKTHGVMNDDFVWLRFEDENITFDKVRMR